MISGGLIEYDGKWRTLENLDGCDFTERSFEKLCSSTLGRLFSTAEVRKELKKLNFNRMLIVDAVLAIICCTRPCGAHYYCMKYFYWNFISSQSHRGVTGRVFHSKKDLQRIENTFRSLLLKIKEKED